MPAILPRQSRPTFYPDWSTLVYAFRGRKAGADAGLREVFNLVRDTAREANLCLSFAHLMELLNDENEDARLQQAVFIDGLDVVWLKDYDEALEIELERVVRRAAGIAHEPLTLPAFPSFLSMFPVTLNHLPDVLHRGSVARMVLDSGDAPVIRTNLQNLRNVSTNASLHFFADRKISAERHTPKELRELKKAKIDRHIEERAGQIGQKLSMTEGSYSTPNGILWRPLGPEFARSSMRTLDEMRYDLPSAYVFFETIWRAGDLVGQQRRIDVAATAEKRRGDVFDWFHTVGAAYCDAFTCDPRTSKCLGDARIRLGRAKEIVFKGGDYSAFAKSIRAVLDF